MTRLKITMLAMILVCVIPICAATVSGTVKDTVSGKAVTGATLILRQGFLPVDTVTADTAGAFSFLTVAAGNYTIRAIAAGYTTKTSAAITVAAAGDPAPTAFLLAPIQILNLSGTITDTATGTAVNAAAIAFRLTAGGGGAITRRDTTAADGKYAVDSVLAGTYTLTVTVAGFITKAVQIVASGTTPMVVNVQLVKIVSATVTGTVTDSVAGTPVTGVAVAFRATNGGATRRDTTAANGVYAFDSVANGTYTVTAAAAGFISKSVNVTAAGLATITANIRLVKIVYATVTGTVTDSLTGALMNGIVVTLRSGGGVGGTVRRDTTAANGVYSFDSVATATYTLSAAATGYLTKTLTVTTRGTGTQTVNLQLVLIQYPVLTGTITDSATGALLNGAIAVLRATGVGGATRRDTTAANGVYSFDSVATGNYTLTVTMTGYVPQVVNVTSSGAGTKSVNVKLVAVSAVESAVFALGKPAFSISTSGLLSMRNFSDAGVVKVYSVNGKLICRRNFTANTASLDFSKSLRGPGAYVVSISQKSGIYTKQQIVMP